MEILWLSLSLLLYISCQGHQCNPKEDVCKRKSLRVLFQYYQTNHQVHTELIQIEKKLQYTGINKVIPRALDTNGVSVYPCKILNRLACPYDKKIVVEDYITQDSITKKPDVGHLMSSRRRG